jgi:hypothetical protein
VLSRAWPQLSDVVLEAVPCSVLKRAPSNYLLP